MASPSVINIIRDSGNLWWNPVSRSNRGTNLGYLQAGFAYAPNQEITKIAFETAGTIPQGLYYSGCECVAAAGLLEVASEVVLQRCFLSTVAAGPDFSMPGTLKTGTSLWDSAIAGSLIFIPDHDTAHPSFYSSACIGIVTQTLRYEHKKIMVANVLFHCKSFRVAPLTTLLSA